MEIKRIDKVGDLAVKTVLVIEDNTRSADTIVKIINDLEMNTTVYIAANAEDAYVLAMKNCIDLFVVDIMLNSLNPGDVSGMIFANNMRANKKYEHTPIIFTTSLEDPKLYAYSDIHCYYYIEKPYDVGKVSKIIAEALSIPRTETDSHNVYFRKDGIIYKKDVSEIIYIENSRSGQTVNLVNGQLKLSYKPTKIILQELNNSCFIQCSRYVIVNKMYIDSVDIVNRYIKLKIADKQLEIGNTFKKSLMKEILDD